MPPEIRPASQQDTIVHDGPEDRCFGCGHANERGLKLVFRPTDGGVETEYQAPEHLAGAPGVIHGGIQATLLDEVLGMAIHVAQGHEDHQHVTVDFRLRYHRPAPTEQALRVRGRCLHTEDRDVFAEGEIVSPEGEVLTRAEARWRRIERRA
jgi:uncharacterized protein (TIGR00369 family)